MTNFNMCASHSMTKHDDDSIFGVGQAAQKAIINFGKEKVVNATIGAIYDDNETLATLPTAEKLFKNLDPKLVAAYAPITGLPDYLEGVKKLTFGNFPPDAYTASVATPGGSGAVSLTIDNYSEENDYILTSNWYWSPYRTMAHEHRRKIKFFNLFIKDRFDFDDFSRNVCQILEKQDSLLIILNSPANNPTGFSLSGEDWENIIGFLKEINPDKKIIILIDIAYIDYASDQNSARKFMTLFGRLPENIFAVIAFSISKSLLMYGLRTGAAIGISSNLHVIDEFKEVMSFSCRGIWSNCNRSGMELVIDILKNNHLGEIVTERNQLVNLINTRAQVFLKESQDAGLITCPYDSGFFISIPHSNPHELLNRLKEKNIFVVELDTGIRIATCALPLNKIKGLAKNIGDCL